MSKELISVIIPVWKPNMEQLKQCLETIVRQTYDELEIVLVYRKLENSVDRNFQSLIEEYHDENRIKVIFDKTAGFVNALNAGIRNSSGTLIGRIDADDFCKITRFEKQVEFMNINHLNIVGTWMYRISSSEKIIGRIEMPVTHNEIRKKMMFHCPMLHDTILMERKMLKKIGLYDPSFVHAEDYELYFRAMYNNYKFGNVPLHLGFVRELADSRSRGSEWREQRRYYIKAKNKAFLHYKFTKPYDIIYHILTPFSYLISPQMWVKIRRITGWNN